MTTDKDIPTTPPRPLWASVIGWGCIALAAVDAVGFLVLVLLSPRDYPTGLAVTTGASLPLGVAMLVLPPAQYAPGSQLLPWVVMLAGWATLVWGGVGLLRCRRAGAIVLLLHSAVTAGGNIILGVVALCTSRIPDMGMLCMLAGALWPAGVLFCLLAPATLAETAAWAHAPPAADGSPPTPAPVPPPRWAVVIGWAAVLVGANNLLILCLLPGLSAGGPSVGALLLSQFIAVMFVPALLLVWGFGWLAVVAGGIGLLRRRPGARAGLLAHAFITLALGLVQVPLFALLVGSMWPLLVGLGLLWPGFLIWWFFRPRIKREMAAWEETVEPTGREPTS